MYARSHAVAAVHWTQKYGKSSDLKIKKPKKPKNLTF